MSVVSNSVVVFFVFLRLVFRGPPFIVVGVGVVLSLERPPLRSLDQRSGEVLRCDIYQGRLPSPGGIPL